MSLYWSETCLLPSQTITPNTSQVAIKHYLAQFKDCFSDLLTGKCVHSTDPDVVLGAVLTFQDPPVAFNLIESSDLLGGIAGYLKFKK